MAKVRNKKCVIPLRIPPDMKIRIERLALKARLGEAAVMRQAIDRGIGEIEQFYNNHEKA